jgi:hypothetical protein
MNCAWNAGQSDTGYLRYRFKVVSLDLAQNVFARRIDALVAKRLVGALVLEQRRHHALPATYGCRAGVAFQVVCELAQHVFVENCRAISAEDVLGVKLSGKSCHEPLAQPPHLRSTGPLACGCNTYRVVPRCTRGTCTGVGATDLVRIVFFQILLLDQHGDTKILAGTVAGI